MDYTIGIRVTGDGRIAVQAIDEVTQAGARMGTALGQSSGQASRSFASVGDAASKMDAQIEHSIGTVAKYAVAIAGIHELGEFASSVVEASTKLAGWNYGLQAATGSQEAARRSLAFVRQESDQLGISLEESASVFTRLAAATRGTALEGEKAQQVFTAVAEASRALHLSGQETSQALLALDQMMSKGQVTAQDLKLQLGNVLPGAVHVMADALGVSTQRLEKMMEAGQVLSDDALPKLAARLHEIYGAAASDAAEAPAAQLQRLKNAVFDLKTAVGDAGFMDVLGEGAKVATAAIGGLANQIAAVETLFASALAGRAAAWLANVVQARVATTATAQLTAAELAEATAAEAEAAAQLSKVKAFAGVATSTVDVAKAEAVLTAAQARTAAATEAANLAGAARIGVLGRIGSTLLSLAGGPIGVAVLAVGALAAGWIALEHAEEERRAQFEKTLQQFDEARQKAQALHQQLQNLAETPPPLADQTATYKSSLDEIAKAQAAVIEKQAEVTRLQKDLQLDALNTSGYGQTSVQDLQRLHQAQNELDETARHLRDLQSAANDLGGDLQQRLAPAIQQGVEKLGELKKAADFGDVLDTLRSGWATYSAGFDKIINADALVQADAKKRSSDIADLTEKLKTAGKTAVQVAQQEKEAELQHAKDSNLSAAQIEQIRKENDERIKLVTAIAAQTKAKKDLAKVDAEYQQKQNELIAKAGTALDAYVTKTLTPVDQAWAAYANVIRTVAEAEGARIKAAQDAVKAGDKNIDVTRVEADAQQALALAIENTTPARLRAIAAAEKQQAVGQTLANQALQEAQIAQLSERNQAIARAGLQASNQLQQEGIEIGSDYYRQQVQIAQQGAAAAYDMQQYAEASRQVAQEFSGFWINAASSVSDSIAHLVSSGLRDWKDFGSDLKNEARQFVDDIISQFLRLNVIGPLLGGAMQGVAGWLGISSQFLGNSLLTVSPQYGGNGSVIGTQAGGVGGAAGGSSVQQLGGLFQNISSAKNLYARLFGGGNAAATPSALAGSGAAYYGPGSTYLGAYGGTQGAGFSGVLANGGGGTYLGPGSTSLGAYGGNVVGYSPYGGSFSVGGYSAPYASAAGALLGAYYGSKQGGGGFSTVASTASYGALGAGIAGTAAGVAGGASLGTAAGSAFGAAAASTSWIPIVGWILAGLAALDHFSGGKVFGTGWRPAQSNVNLDIGPQGSSASADETLWKYKGQTGLSLGGFLTGGLSQLGWWGDKKTKTEQLAVTPEMLKAAQQLYDSVEKVLVSGAQKLGIDVPQMIQASLTAQTTYDKKGKPQGTEYLVQYLGRTWKEATADAAAQRIGAEALIATVTASAGQEAQRIAEQWRDSAATLADGAQLLLEAQTDINHGNSLVALGSTATLTQITTFVEQLQQDGETLADAYARLAQASQQYLQFVAQFSTQGTDFGSSLEAINQQLLANIQQANALAQAAGLQGAREEDLAKIHQYAAQQAAQAIAQLDSAAQDLVTKLYGVTNGSLAAVSAQLDAMKAKVQASTQTAIGDLSPLNDKDKLDLALKGLRSGVTSADDVLNLGRKLYSSSSDYTGLYNLVMSIVGGGTDGTSGADVGTQLDQYNQLAAQQQQLQAQADATARFSDAKQLAQYLADISTVHGVSYQDAASSLGLNLSDLAKDLGLTNLTGYLDQLKAEDIAGTTQTAAASIVDAIRGIGSDIVSAILQAPVVQPGATSASGGNAPDPAQQAILDKLNTLIQQTQQVIVHTGTVANGTGQLVDNSKRQALRDTLYAGRSV